MRAPFSFRHDPDVPKFDDTNSVAVMDAASQADVVVMAAAVADYAPARQATEKIAKIDGGMTLTLERTRDILADLARLPSRAAARGPVLVGFAAETGDAVAKARAKRAKKDVDLMVANDVSQPGVGFDSETNAVTLVSAGDERTVPLQSKDRIAAAILDRVEELIHARAATPVRA